MSGESTSRKKAERATTSQLRSAFRKLGGRTIRTMDKLLPHAPWIDRSFRVLRFWQANGRLPRASTDPQATFNDFILHRMIRNDWSQLERVCIDKQYAKLLATAMSPNVRGSKTKLVLPLSGVDGIETAVDALAARVGQCEVAKPTHGSGSILFLRDAPSQNLIKAFCEVASRSYYASSRESQYSGLERKIIIEEDLSIGGSVPADYKFFCSHGEVLFCQVDLDRFIRHRRRLVTPAFEPIDVRFAYDLPEKIPPKPLNFDEMLRIAQELSRFFCFVRIDLYSIGSAVYFGEFTFAPEGGAGALSSEEFGIGIMGRIRGGLPKQDAEL